MRTSFFKIPFFFAAALLVSCDKDFNEIGSSVVGDDHYLFDVDSSFTVKAYNRFYGDVQTSKTTTSSVDMPINSLGYYNNSVFGKVTASFVTQVELATPNPTFGDSVHVKKVELTIPYFSKIQGADDDGNRLYRLDSIQGNSKINLSIRESGYFLRDFDPSPGSDLQEIQRYYSDQLSAIEASAVSGTLNDSSAVKQNSEFFFDPAEIVTYKTVNGLQQVDKREAPMMKLSLNRDYFRTKIFGLDQFGNTVNDARSKLFNNNVFKNYFRGLFFKVQPGASSPDPGSLAQLNFGSGKVTITYSVLTNRKDSDGNYILVNGKREREDKTFVLNLKGNTVNFFENEYNPTYFSQVNSPETANGDDRLWLKGGAGSMAIIDLFGTQDLYRYDDDDDPNNADDPNLPNTLRMGPNNVPDELDDLRHNNWLINDAMLTFYVDESNMGTEKPNYRIYLYDLNNNRPLVDYAADASTIPGEPNKDKFVHGGLLTKANNGVRKYTVRIANHLRNLSKKGATSAQDSTNVRLGLVVTETIGNVSNKRLRTPVEGVEIDRVPSASVSKQRGVVLHGSTANQGQGNENKRIKLKIYYTKPE